MRRRLLIARALVHRPRLVLLDEPTVGLDPQVRQELWALIDALRAEGTTILMSTHYIEEAQRLADTVLIMSHGKAVAAGPAGRARRASTPAARRSRSTARRRGSPRSRPRRARRACARGARARASRSSASTAATGTRSRASGGRRTSRTSSCSSPARRSTDGRSRPRGRAARPARAPGAHGRARPRDRQLLVLLALEHVLLDGRADDLPARVRLRLRLARQHDRRLRLRRVRRHRHRRDGGAVLERLPGDVRDVRQVPVPAHVRRDPRGAGRHRGARHGRGALDRDAGRRLRLRADARRDVLRARPVVGDAARAVHRAGSPASAGRASASRSPASRSRSRTSTTSSAPC